MKTSFWKIMAASMVGFILASIVATLLFMGAIGSLVSKFGDAEKIEIEDESVLKIDLSLAIPDRTPQNPFESFNFDPYDMKKITGLNDMLRNLERAKEDDEIEGIYLDISIVTCGMATAEELRNAIIDFRESSGKWVIAYATNMTQKGYYIATAADEIYMDPQAWMDFRGLSAQVMYYKNALEKLGVEPQVFRHGKFKSAVEPFLIDEMSEANRLQTLTYLNSMWDHMLTRIAETRDISVEELNELADSLSLNSAQTAVDYGLIDGLKYKDEIFAMINDKIGNDAEEEIEFMSMAKYNTHNKMLKIKNAGKDEIAVIFAEGNIVMGNGDESKIGGDRFAKAIREARLDDDVKAIVIRVNSPGGSGQASEIMWREIVLAKKDKPVVISMGNLAASGGYYIACAADYIYAHPNTITGSIGVFGLMFSGEELIQEKIGINVEVVNTNEHSDMGNIARQFSEKERAYMQGMVEGFYDVFITRVADGRGMTKAEVDEVGQGRVWTGENALDHGLIDGFGGLEDATNKAAELAELDDYTLTEMPKAKDFMEILLEDFSMQTRIDLLSQIPGFNTNAYQQIQNFVEMEQGVYARMMMDVEIK
ncbi:MAG: signal peptide peptidase SppA [Bacteroidota bacterium]|nr:signal peptide peptidase SppA [Bacteroidota bacterium]